MIWNSCLSNPISWATQSQFPLIILLSYFIAYLLIFVLKTEWHRQNVIVILDSIIFFWESVVIFLVDS